MNEVLIGPTGTPVLTRLRELWHARELIYFLTWREIQIRHKQTAIGIAWVVLQPLLTMAIFSVVMGRLAKVPSDGLPYPLFSLAGLVPWSFFSAGISQATNSLVQNPSLVTKVYFPRMAVPGATLLAGLVDFLINLTFLLVAMVYYGVAPTWACLWMPLLTLQVLVAATGASLLLAALNVEYRDVRYALPFVAQVWMFLTPVLYPVSLFPAQWRLLFALNPMAGAVEGFRWSLVGTPLSADVIAVSAVSSLVVFAIGFWYFQRSEASFADVI